MPSQIIFSEKAESALVSAINLAKSRRHEFVCPEHLLLTLLDDISFTSALNPLGNLNALKAELEKFLEKTETIPERVEDWTPDLSFQMNQLLQLAHTTVETSSAQSIDVPQLVNALLSLPQSWASRFLIDNIKSQKGEFLSALISEYGSQPLPSGEDFTSAQVSREEDWRRLVTCMNDHHTERNPLIGRTDELQRTIQVLCRREKNNPLHVGDPGVGKTALVWGLVRLIEEGKVPERLRGSKVYLMEVSSLLAGTQFRGDFEKRLKTVMEGIMAEGENNIVYIDEIHTIVGAGATGEGAVDASNILKPYLENGSIRFIGSTTYEELNRQFSKSRGLARRFQQIDIGEPSVEEARGILRQLQPIYEKFHGVTYTKEGIDFAVEASAKHIPDRRLPDKAIDLIDEAGAAMEISGNKNKIGVKEIAAVLAKICKTDALAVAEKDDYERLEDLSERMLERIYGQDEAVRQVVESVQMARAGLLDDNKPQASLLFVGPTGVGKTEVARVLSDQLGVPLVRFDMSEYSEKHSVAKLIGSPAGYVGYEDGGLLTDAIRKSPNCVLLLDEIEKAHGDIYNILLQVMDYARLSDNKGRQSDFRNVILIMTSNAGAQFASKTGMGFASTATRGGEMMKQVKKTFKPEFLNRLSAAVVFNDMDIPMAKLILRKKLSELKAKLKEKKVYLIIEPEAFDYLLKEGFTPEYGAREMDRVIRQQLNPLLMREILFGKFRKGGVGCVYAGLSGLRLNTSRKYFVSTLRQKYHDPPKLNQDQS